MDPSRSASRAQITPSRQHERGAPATHKRNEPASITMPTGPSSSPTRRAEEAREGLRSLSYERRCATPPRSSSSSASVFLIAAWLNSSIGRSFTIVYSPFSVVTGKPKMTPSGMP